MRTKILNQYEKYGRKLFVLRGNFIDRLKDKPCADCKRKYHPWQMDFDHIDPKTKSYSVSQMRRFSAQRILEEIRKCELVCSNCHKDRMHHRYTVLQCHQRNKTLSNLGELK